MASTRLMENVIESLKAKFPVLKVAGNDLSHRLKALSPTITEITKLSGTPGASVGVLHQNEIIHIENFGYRDLEAKLVPDEYTLYYIASMTKAFTAACIGILVDEKKLTWQTPVSQILPEFDHPDDLVKSKAVMIDFLSHRTGLASKNQMWWLEFGVPSLPRRETMHFCSYLDVVHPYQSRWLYNNWGYGLADEVVSKLSGESWGTFLKDKILHPLGMNQTTTDLKPESEDVAKAYMALANGTPYPVPRPSPEDGSLNEGAAAIQSNVNDLLKFYKHVMFVAEEEEEAGRMNSSTLKNVTTQLQSHIDLDGDTSSSERSYGLGWVRTQLPGLLGIVGLNPMYVDKMPTVGKGLGNPRTCLYHNGSLQSFLSSVHILPDTRTVIVVLTNSMANNDAADWIGELLLEAVLNNTDKNDYVAIAKASAAESVALWPRMARELEEKRIPDTAMKINVTLHWIILELDR